MLFPLGVLQLDERKKKRRENSTGLLWVTIRIYSLKMSIAIENTNGMFLKINYLIQINLRL